MDVRSRRVTSTQAWKGRLPRRSEISSNEEVGLLVGTTKLGFVGVAAEVFTLAAALFVDLADARLGATVDISSVS